MSLLYGVSYVGAHRPHATVVVSIVAERTHWNVLVQVQAGLLQLGFTLAVLRNVGQMCT